MPQLRTRLVGLAAWVGGRRKGMARTQRQTGAWGPTNLAKHRVLAVERLQVVPQGDEELGAVAVAAVVDEGQGAETGVLLMMGSREDRWGKEGVRGGG